MKAAIHRRYGGPEVISIEEIERPIPGNNEVLIRVHAATVNRTDCANLTAKPFIMRFSQGLFKPKKPIPGTDFAGEIVQVGNQVSTLQVGDRVFGFDDTGLMSHAEYMTFSAEKGIGNIPERISFEMAAASLEGFHYAYNFINKVKLTPENKVLVNGASGAIGSAILQLVKNIGAQVTATCATDKLERIESLGADRVIDYLKEDFTKDHERYDFVFDSVGKSSFGKCKSILKPQGIYMSSELGWMAQNVFYALVEPLMPNKKVKFPMPTDIKRSIEFVRQLLAEGKFVPLIDRSFSLDEVADAFDYVLTGQKTGNVLVSMID